MTTILDLPDEIHLQIGAHLNNKAYYSLIRVCHSLYSSYMPCLWADVDLQHFKGNIIPVAVVHTNASRIEATTYSANLTEEYYALTYPRLRTLRMMTFYTDENRPHYLQVSPAQKIQFIRHHPFVRTLAYQHRDTVPKEFWEVIGTEWTHLETLHFSGVINADAMDAFWRVCDRVQDLRLMSVNLLPESVPILSTLSFRRLQKLMVTKFNWRIPHRKWPLHLLKQIKRSPSLRYLAWNVSDIPFPFRLFQETLVEEGCWPELCALSIRTPTFIDQDWTTILRTLPSRRLTECGWLGGGTFGSLTYNCLREMYFGHLQELRVRRCNGVTSVMVQELLTKCIHLVHFTASYIYVRDIATAPKPWGCSRMENLAVYIVKDPEDEAAWEGRVFEQISKLRRLLVLNLKRYQVFNMGDDDDRVLPHSMETLDLRLGCSSIPRDSSNIGGDGARVGRRGNGNSCKGADISCWSSLVQLQEVSFDGDRQTIGMEEALWMTEHWRDLWCICGGFGGVSGDDKDKLDGLFADKVITYICK
ncbi:hypothetical protein BG015_011389 [Linnemannia schmuckeri]|uniref:F-box domain-containing protein n=1 Tax=Linnemannia schmuckeri TaxID=64567 RepID=A0A9P5RW62_9FUNG|nr:hypothetical protein BG015_011389 [Linnemannia schmuckeri]